MGCVCAEERSRDVSIPKGKKPQPREHTEETAPPVRQVTLKVPSRRQSEQSHSPRTPKTHSPSSLTPKSPSPRGTPRTPHSPRTPSKGSFASTPRASRRSSQVLQTAFPAPIKLLTVPIHVLYHLGEATWVEENYTMKPAEHVRSKQPCCVFVRAKPAKYRKEHLNVLLEPVTTLRQFDHPSILKVEEVLEDSSAIYVVTEACSAVRLSDYLESRGELEERVAAELVREVVSAVRVCHSRKVLLRNLSPATLAFAADPHSVPEQVKIFDFSDSMPTDSFKPMSTRLRNSVYVAPEVWKSTATEESDVWSIGVLAFFVLSKTLPFSPREKLESKGAWSLDFSAKPWKSVSQSAKDFVASLLAAIPSKRPSPADCLHHPWLSGGKRDGDGKLLSATFKGLSAAQGLTEAKVVFSRFILDRVVKNSALSKLARTFQQLDVDGNSLLSKDELLLGLKKVMPGAKAEKEADRIMAVADVDSSGQIDYTEFLQTAYGEQRLFSSENLVAAFNTIDSDGDGKIALEELKGALELSGAEKDEEVWARLMAGMDSSGDGMVDFAEFQAAVKAAVGA